MTCQAILDTDASLHDRRLGVAAGSFPDGRGPVICGSFNRNTSCPVSGSPAFPIDARDRKLCVPASRRVYPCLDELLVLSNLNYRPSDPIVKLFVVYLSVDFRGQAPPLPAEPGCSRQDPENWPQGTTGNRMAASATGSSQTQATFCYASGLSVGWRLPRRTW